MQKCFGKDCIVGFLCKQTESLEDLYNRCSYFQNVIHEKIKQLSKDLDKEEREEEITDIIYFTFEEVLNNVNHPYKEDFIDELIYQIGDSDGFFFDLVHS